MTEPLSDTALRRLLAIANEPEAPDLPARYRIVRELGRGGMGVVYEAHDTGLDRRCAVKVLGATNGPGDELRARFAREALAAARLRHPNLAAIFDAAPGYISMQLVAGGPITTIPSSERRLLVELVRDAALAVQHAHEQGIVHRDLKPSNLLVEGRHVFVVDFGLAKELHAESGGVVSLAVVGTPAYMPPEQARGRGDAVDARSDVYALGATLWHCLCGEPPFPGNDLADVLRRVIAEDPPRSGVERDLDLVMRKCLAKEPAQRYASAAELAADLDRWLRDEPVHARRPSLAYRLRKLARRHRTLVRAALVATLATALVLVPIALRENAARTAAGAAVAFSERAATVLADAAVFTRLGDLASANQALDACIGEARTFLERHEVARVRHVLARLLRARGRAEDAIAELERALAGEPDLGEARFERGLMRAASPAMDAAGRQAALADLTTSIPRHSALTGLDQLCGRAERHRLQGELEQAREIFEEVLAYDPTHVAARTALARIALALGDGNLARYYSASAVDLQQGYGPVYLTFERRSLPTRILGLEDALVDFTSCLADGPDNALAMAQRGLVQLRRSLRLEREGDPDEALAAALAAVEDHDATLTVHPDLAGAFNNRAVCFLRVERLHSARGEIAAAVEARGRAEADLLRALAREPSLREALGNSGRLALRTGKLALALGRPAAALAHLERALDALRRALDGALPQWPQLLACRMALADAESARAATLPLVR